jgi:hypothetical protein
MFTLEELSRIGPTLPEDYPEKSKEFWDYVDEKLRTQRAVHKLYYDSLTKIESVEKALEFIKQNNEHCYDIVERLVGLGAKLEATEDPLLVEETASWISMLKDETDLATEEMLAKNMIDRDKYVAKKITESLGDGETGILFLAPGRQVSGNLGSASDLRAIKIQPFDPADYLNSWLVSKSLKAESKNQEEKEQATGS